MILVNGVDGGLLTAGDRGLAYGDGVFRTLRLIAGKPQHWQRQFRKLHADAAAIGIACPPAETLAADLKTIAAILPDGVIRITLTRGTAPRGYAIPVTANGTRIVSWSALPPAQQDGDRIRARWCALRLGIQPALAGIKHLNRLEQVLARSEWQDPAISEGLLCDMHGNVISGTMSNLFLLRDDSLITPQLDQCGIAGMTRELIMDCAQNAGLPVTVRRVSVTDVLAADALYLVNSVTGVRQIAELDAARWGALPFTQRLAAWVNDGEKI